MHVLVPLTVTDSLLSSSTVAETDHAAWVAGTAYALGDRVIRTGTHRVYESLQAANTGKTPEASPSWWLDLGPTNRWAMFDTTVSTATTATGSLTVVLRPGFFNALALYKLTGATLTVTVKDTPGGAVTYSRTLALDGPYFDWYDWAFGPFRPRAKVVLSEIVPYPGAELTLTIAAGAGEPVGIGMLAVGDRRPLILGDWGGTEYGAKAEPVDYSYIKTDDFGETKIVKRRNATDMRVEVILPREDADYALATVQEVLAVPAAWIATTAAGYDGLNVFGLGSGSLSYDSYGHAVFSINVKGLV